MNNKPVAWMYRIKDTDNRWELAWIKPATEDMFDTEPLYTHPVKELTDEEIQEVAHGFGAIGWMGDTTYEFARAIEKRIKNGN